MPQLRRWDAGMVQIGLKTPLEEIEPGCSDCHARSSHSLYHYFVAAPGIRPAGPGFANAEIASKAGRHDASRLTRDASDYATGRLSSVLRCAVSFWRNAATLKRSACTRHAAGS